MLAVVTQVYDYIFTVLIENYDQFDTIHEYWAILSKIDQ